MLLLTIYGELYYRFVVTENNLFFIESVQTKCDISIPDMLETELDWLSSYVTSDNAELRDTDNVLIAGHLRLVETLLKAENVDKIEIGKFSLMIISM